MGQQLWTSDVTGYRRRGTRLSELVAVLGSDVTTRSIIEPLQSAPAQLPAQEAKRLLTERGFDVAGVQDREGGPVLGVVIAEELLSGTVFDHLKPLRAEELISDSTPLSELLGILRKKEHAFVVVRSGVRAIVSQADLNKPPVRVYLFGLISLLEMHLRFWISKEYPEETWQSKIKEERLNDARTVLVERKRHDEATTLLDCLQFCDKALLVACCPELLAKLKLTSKNKAGLLFRRAERLRNNLAHSQLDLAGSSSWETLLDRVEEIERFVRLSDEMIENEVQSVRENFRGGLWSNDWTRL